MKVVVLSCAFIFILSAVTDMAINDFNEVNWHLKSIGWCITTVLFYLSGE